MPYLVKVVGEDDLRKIVTQVIAAQGSQQKAAALFGVSQGFLSDVVRKHRSLGSQIPQVLGYEEIRAYRKRDDT